MAGRIDALLLFACISRSAVVKGSISLAVAPAQEQLSHMLVPRPSPHRFAKSSWTASSSASARATRATTRPGRLGTAAASPGATAAAAATSTTSPPCTPRPWWQGCASGTPRSACSPRCAAVFGRQCLHAHYMAGLPLVSGSLTTNRHSPPSTAARTIEAHRGLGPTRSDETQKPLHASQLGLCFMLTLALYTCAVAQVRSLRSTNSSDINVAELKDGDKKDAAADNNAGQQREPAKRACEEKDVEHGKTSTHFWDRTMSMGSGSHTPPSSAGQTSARFTSGHGSARFSSGNITLSRPASARIVPESPVRPSSSGGSGSRPGPAALGSAAPGSASGSMRSTTTNLAP